MSEGVAENLKNGIYEIESVFPSNSGKIQFENVYSNLLALHSIRMPSSVSGDRTFIHDNYYFERDSKTIPINTNNAYIFNNQNIIFM